MDNFLGCLLGLVIIIVEFAFGIAITCVLASWLCDIEPNEHYSWYSGIWHGLFCILQSKYIYHLVQHLVVDYLCLDIVRNPFRWRKQS